MKVGGVEVAEEKDVIVEGRGRIRRRAVREGSLRKLDMCLLMRETVRAGAFFGNLVPGAN